MSYTAINVNEGTAASIYTDNTGGTGGTQIGVVKLDISGQGTAGTLWGGNVGVSSGTITTLPNLPGGSIAVTAGTVVVTTHGTIDSGSISVIAGTIASVGTIGTLGLGSVVVNTLPNLPQGSINITAGTIATLGTMGTLGLVNTVTTVSNLSQGSINVTAGTIATLGTMGTLGLVNTVTTVSNLSAGSVNVIAGTIATLGTMGTLGLLVNGTLANSGTTTGVGTVTNLGSVTNLGQVYNAGTVQNQLAGTITALQNGTITGGTLQNLNFGTIAISDGTTKGNVMASGVSNGTGAQNAQLIAGGFTELSGSATGLNGDIIPSTDVSNYKWISIHLNNTFVGTAQLQASNDNSTFTTSTLIGNTSTVSAPFSSMNSTTSIYYAPLSSRYIRIRASAFTSGTIGGVVELYTTPGINQSMGVTAAQTGAWNVGGTLNAGTIGTVTNLGQVYNAGTIQAGTIQNDPLPVRAISTFGTHGTTGVSIFGTLAGGTGSGAGTEIFITSLSLSIPSTGGSQDVSVGWGSNGGTFHAGTGRLIRGNFPAGGGIQKEFNPAINSGTNAQLMCFQAGAGTVDIDVTYFTTPSSL